MAKLTLDGQNLLIDGVPALLQAGTFHYYRLPHRDLWKPVLDQLRVGGFNAVMVSFPWAYHSPAEGFYDFTGPRDLDYLLKAIADAGLWFIPHVGPWVGSHLGAGGLPTWVVASQSGATAPDEADPAGPSRTYLRHLTVWWRRLFPFFASQPNCLLTVLHPGRWSYPVNPNAYQLPFVALAAQCGMVTPWAWPARAGLSGIAETVPASIWTIHSDDYADPATADAHHAPLFVVPHLGQPQRLNGLPDPPAVTETPSAHALENMPITRAPLPMLLTAGVRAVALDPGHKGCNWGYWGALGLGTAYGAGAPLDESYGAMGAFYHMHRLTISLETLSQVLLTATAEAVIYAAPAETLKAAAISPGGSAALLESTSKTNQYVRLSLPQGDEVLMTDEITLPAFETRLLPLNLPIAQGMIESTTLELQLITAVAGRTLCILRNDEGGDVTLSDAFRPLHSRGAVFHKRVPNGWHIHFDRAKLSSIVFDGPESRLQLLALAAPYADYIWPLDDAWRSTPAFGAGWSPTLEDPARGVVIGPDLVLPDRNGTYHFLVSEKGFGYRWGPWRGSDPRTWLAPISWQSPTASVMPVLQWEKCPGVLETRPDYPDTSWRSLAPDGFMAMEDLNILDGFIWYRGTYQGYAESVNLQCRHDCDVFLNGQHVAALKVPPDFSPTGSKLVPLPGRYQTQSNLLAILVENAGRSQDLDKAAEKHGLLSAVLNPEIPIQWRVRGGLLGEQRVQGFSGFADWHLLPTEGDPAITWHRSAFNLNIPRDTVQPVYFVLENTPAKVFIYLNGALVGRALSGKTSQRRFWLPEGLLNLHGDNELLVAQWTRGADPYLGAARLESGTVRAWHTETFGAR